MERREYRLLEAAFGVIAAAAGSAELSKGIQTTNDDEGIDHDQTDAPLLNTFLKTSTKNINISSSSCIYISEDSSLYLEHFEPFIALSSS